MASVSKVLWYDALDGSIMSPLQITAFKLRTTLVRDAVNTQDLCDSTGPRKRKTRQASDDLSSSVAPSICKRRCPNTTDYGLGKFGSYTLADTSATAMTMPVHDPKPADIHSCRTHDPNGNPPERGDLGLWN
ncbi:hypothetical protein BDR06DRAFT_616757 [Suillus hirtellus]|nr:hypothetical protein BDR06DRAFT_616757 [Suillus hirtellus]